MKEYPILINGVIECASPFYSAYAPQADIINAAVDKAIEESAEKMGSLITEIYSIGRNHELQFSAVIFRWFYSRIIVHVVVYSSNNSSNKGVMKPC